MGDMRDILGAAGAERAECSLCDFVGQVRAAQPSDAPSPHQMVLRSGMQTLERRCIAARRSFDALNAAATTEAGDLAREIAAGAAEVEALPDDVDAARMEEATLRLDALSRAAHAVTERVMQVRRASAWLAEVHETTSELMARDAQSDHGVDAPGLLRTLTELGVLLNRIADAARVEPGAARPRGPALQRRKTDMILSPETARRDFQRLAAQVAGLASGTGRTTQGGEYGDTP
jgi:hypothetical protein